jgi:hypothetical protein
MVDGCRWKVWPQVGRVSSLRAGAGLSENGAHGVTRPAGFFKIAQLALRQQIVKWARRARNRGSSFQKRGKGQKIGARPEKSRATAHHFWA